jgi:hypothetical protein
MYENLEKENGIRDRRFPDGCFLQGYRDTSVSRLGDHRLFIPKPLPVLCPEIV